MVLKKKSEFTPESGIVDTYEIVPESCIVDTFPVKVAFTRHLMTTLVRGIFQVPHCHGLYIINNNQRALQ